MARPGAVIVALVVGLSHLGDVLRDALDLRNGSGR
jgi:peptide/nickel transport system permease protein